MTLSLRALGYAFLAIAALLVCDASALPGHPEGALVIGVFASIWALMGCGLLGFGAPKKLKERRKYGE